jgi:hypothetical protein
MIARKFIGLWRKLRRISKHLAEERVFVCMNRRFDEGNFMTFRSKEAGQSAVVTSSKPK